MWVYVFLGNALRGIGETPIIPLGFSYIDDFTKADESPFFIGETDFCNNSNGPVLRNSSGVNPSRGPIILPAALMEADLRRCIIHLKILTLYGF